MTMWRRRLVRGAVLAAAGGVACAAALAYQLTGSAAVRQQVLGQLRKHFVGGDIALGAARFRLLGGVTIENFTLYRLDDPARTPVLHIPSGVIYHDKEQLARGRLAIRKLKLERPRLTVVRSPDGRWNLGGILGPVHPEIAIPIIEVEQATVLLEIAGTAPTDGGPTPTPFRVELRGVNATVLNQPLAVLNIQVHGEAVALGPLHVEGSWHRTQERLDATMDLAPVPITTALVRELSRFAPGLGEQVLKVSGVARVHAGVQYRKGAAPAWRHQVRADLSNGLLIHRDLPLPLDHLEVSAKCDDGAVAIDHLTANAGSAAVTMKCQFMPISVRPSPSASEGKPTSLALGLGQTKSATPAGLDPVRSLDLTVTHLPITPDLFNRLPASFQKYQQLYAPTGPCDLSVKLDRASDRWSLKARLRPDGMAGRFEAFPYPVKEVRGNLDLTMAADRPPRLEADLTAEANDHRPVTIQGNIEGDGPSPAFAVTIRADALSLDDTLLLALPAKLQNVARSYHPRGRCDVTARLTRPAGQTQADQQYTIGLRGDCAVCYDLFPVPLNGLTGSLDVHFGPSAPATTRGNWLCSFNEVRATHAGGKVVLAGQARPTDDGTRVDLAIHGRAIPLDETLARAFERMKLRNVWEMFRPAGRFDFAAEVSHTDRQLGPPEYDIRVSHTGAIVTPTFFPLELADLSGSFHLRPGLVEVGAYTAQHGPTRFDLAGGRVVFSDGAYRSDMRGLAANPLPLDAAFVHALPAALQSVCHSLEPVGTLAVDIDQLVITHPPELPGPAKPSEFYWDGRVSFADASLHTGVAWTGVTGQIASQGRYCGQVLEEVKGHIQLDRATVFGQPLTGLHADTWVLKDAPHVLQLQNVHGQLFGGQIGGQARVAFGAGLLYELDLKAIGVRLEDIARHNHVGGGTRLSGLAKAELYLTGTGNGVNELQGGGNVHVPSGQLYNLPLVLDLLKVVTALHAPDGTAFEEAHAEFKVHGKRVQVERLDLLGSAVSLGGKGELDIDGSNVAMDFYAVWGHVAQMLPPGLREVPPWLSKNLLLVKARGKIGGELEIRPEPVPMIVDPVRRIMNRINGRSK
jgi:hypothetical protein